MALSCSPSRAGQAAGDAGKRDLPGEQAGEAESDIKGTQLVGLVRLSPRPWPARPAAGASEGRLTPTNRGHRWVNRALHVSTTQVLLSLTEPRPVI